MQSYNRKVRASAAGRGAGAAGCPRTGPDGVTILDDFELSNFDAAHPTPTRTRTCR